MRFVGPVRSGAGPDPDLSYWWADLDYSLPVVHVTQGTVANANLGQLLVPALRALAGEDVLVVAATGGRPLAALTTALGGPLPANARVAEFLPYGDLLPRTRSDDHRACSNRSPRWVTRSRRSPPSWTL